MAAILLLYILQKLQEMCIFYEDLFIVHNLRNNFCHSWWLFTFSILDPWTPIIFLTL
jgi:hypothetical protein